MSTDELKDKLEQLDIRGTAGRIHTTPTSVTLFDNQDRLIETFAGVCNIKDMFDEYFANEDNSEYFNPHFQHHCNVVQTIGNIYSICEDIGVKQ
jgi:hypothetical protein